MSSPFRSGPIGGYAAEIQNIAAGFHSILRISLDALSAAQSPMVVHHEILHERILTRTPDGNAHLLLKYLSVDHEISATTRSWAGNWCRAIEQSSAIAHETIATYCAIKQLDHQDHKSALESLSPPYVEWYQNLAKLIDPIITSSYTQYLVGWFVAEMCFATSFSERLSNISLHTEVMLEQEERPNWRLHRILESLTVDSMSDLLRTLQASTNTDIQNEEAWESLPLPDRKQLDNALSKQIREWGRLRDFGVDTFAMYGDWKEIGSKLAAKIDYLQGLTPSLVRPPNTDAEAGRLTEAQLINRHIARPVLPEAVSDEQLHSLAMGGQQPHLALLIASATSSGDCEARQWIAALEGRGELSRGAISGGLTSSKSLKQILNARRNEIDSGRRTRNLSTFLVGVGTVLEFSDHVPFIAEHMCLYGRHQSMNNYGWDRLIWYASGDYLKMLRAVSDISDHTAFLSAPLSFTATGLLGVGRAPEASKKFDLILHCAHATKSGIDTRLIRILNPIASGYAMQFESEIINNGKGSRKMFENLDNGFFVRLARLVGIVTALWPEY